MERIPQLGSPVTFIFKVVKGEVPAGLSGLHVSHMTSFFFGSSWFLDVCQKKDNEANGTGLHFRCKSLRTGWNHRQAVVGGEMLSTVFCMSCGGGADGQKRRVGCKKAWLSSPGYLQDSESPRVG